MTAATIRKSHVTIPSDLHREAKAAAASAGMTLERWLELAVKERLSK